MSDRAVEWRHEPGVCWHEQQKSRSLCEAGVQPFKSASIIDHVLEHVETDRRVEAVNGRFELRELDLADVDLIGRKTDAELRRERRIRLKRGHVVCVTEGELDKRPNPSPDIEDSAADVSSSASVEPLVVSTGVGEHRQHLAVVRGKRRRHGF